MGLIVLSAVVAASLHTGNTYTLELSHETAERDRLLFTPAPYPANRVDDPAREELGRVWHSRSPVGSRTPIAEQVYGSPGAAAFGAPIGASDDLIEVRADVVPVLISPWETIGDVDEHYLRRYRPWVKLTEREEMIHNMRRAQHLWLKEQGYIGGVRTHVNASARRSAPAAGIQDVKSNNGPIRPRGVIRKHPKEESAYPMNVSLPNDDTIIRVSLPDHAQRDVAPIEVVRESASEADTVSVNDIVEEQDASAS